MLFVTTLEIPRGGQTQAIGVLKNIRSVPGVEILRTLVLFGSPDAMILFESPDEKSAADFVLQFRGVMSSKTSLCVSPDEL